MNEIELRQRAASERQAVEGLEQLLALMPERAEIIESLLADAKALADATYRARLALAK